VAKYGVDRSSVLGDYLGAKKKSSSFVAIIIIIIRIIRNNIIRFAVQKTSPLANISEIKQDIVERKAALQNCNISAHALDLVKLVHKRREIRPEFPPTLSCTWVTFRTLLSTSIEVHGIRFAPQILVVVYELPFI